MSNQKRASGHCRTLLASCLFALLIPLSFADAQSRLVSPESDQEPSSSSSRPRARDLRIQIGILETGKHNAITDVEGVMVGHRTIIEGKEVRTGVTVVLPHAGNLFQQKVPAAIVVGNGFGKLLGSTQVEELGELETPIALTNTLSTFTVADALVKYTLGQPNNDSVRSVNPVVGECNDGYLNNIRSQSVTAQHVFEAIESASPGPVDEGSVGAGTGTRCLGWKGGIGTSSRVTPEKLGGHTLGVLVQTNFGGRLTVDGVRVGEALGRFYLQDQLQDEAVHEKGSCIIVLATDAPLDARQLTRLARRALFGLAAIGSPMTHGSGDYVIAFSTNQGVRIDSASRVVERAHHVELLHDQSLSPLFEAAREATEEALLNSLLTATTVTGFRGRQTTALPIKDLMQVLEED